MFKALRMAAVTGLVALTSTGLLVTSAGTAQADVVWGSSERLGIQLLTRGLAKGVAGGAPGIAARGLAQEAKCAAAGPGAAACLAVTTAGIVGVTALGLTADKWVPWLWDKAGLDASPWNGDPTTTPSDMCPGGQWDGYPCYNAGTYTFMQPPAVEIDAEGRQTALVRMRLTYAENPGVGSSWKPWEPVLTFGMDCLAPGATQPERFYVASHAGDLNGTAVGAEFPPQRLTCTYGHELVALTFDGVRRTGNGFYSGFLTSTRVPMGTTSSGDSKVTAQIQCKRPDGTEYQVNAEAEPRDGHALIPHCDPGDIPQDLSLSTPTQAGPKIDLRGDDPTSKMMYPQCAGNACLYAIEIDGQPCVAGAGNCEVWTEVNRLEPDRVECLYGPYAVSKDLCLWMENAYSLDASKRVSTIPNTDGDPRTNGEQKYPIVYPRPAPDTGTEIVVTPRPPVVTQPRIPSEQCINGLPGCVTTSDPKVTPDEQRDCWPNGWGALNPANWVLQPITCAFKPNSSTISDQVTRVDVAWLGTNWSVWTNTVADLFDVQAPTGQGCQGPSLVLPEPLSITMHPYSTCGAMATAAQIVKVGLSGVLVFGAAAACVRLLMAGFGYQSDLGKG